MCMAFKQAARRLHAPAGLPRSIVARQTTSRPNQKGGEPGTRVAEGLTVGEVRRIAPLPGRAGQWRLKQGGRNWWTPGAALPAAGPGWSLPLRLRGDLQLPGEWKMR